MTSLARKLVIVAAVDGLLLQPASQRNNRSVPGIQIRYTTNEITQLDPLKQDHDSSSKSLEAYGIVGLFTVAASSYLVSISSRRLVAQIRGKEIYVIAGVALIPLSSQSEAQKTIEQVRQNLKKASSSGKEERDTTDSETSEDEGVQLASQLDGPDEEVRSTSPVSEIRDGALDRRPSASGESSVAEDVFNKKGAYGRFAERWFSKKGWSVDKRRNLGMSTNDDPTKEFSPVPSGGKEGQDTTDTAQPKEGVANTQPGNLSVAYTLLPKLLRTTRLLLCSESFFFSYDHDITRRIGSDPARNRDLPLHKIVDPLYFWNRSLASPFINAGQHRFILPIMQGFIGQRVFTVNTKASDPSEAIAALKANVDEVIELQDNASGTSNFTAQKNTTDFLITLISRRSIMRPGLRYLRRGIDDEGHTANSVETEQILSSPSWSSSEKIYSFTQIRGSIPLYFSQSPYSFKPVPILHHSFPTNHTAFKRHFADVSRVYDNVQIVVLVDKHGVEAKIGEEYEEHTKHFNGEVGANGKNLGFEWFDFHNICRGMKFENVSILMDTLALKLKQFGTTVEFNNQIQSLQSGVLRVNCMDCLDRTNVVQSACGQRALEKQLEAEGVTINLQADNSTQWFNTLWADNGDAISKQYSSTAALKGDFTRTRKRNYRGAINDLNLTLARYFNNIVNDYFSQAAIDFLLGNVTHQVFEEFEANMRSGDPAMSMQKVRQSAIDTSSKIVIADSTEELIGGWTLLCPQQFDTVRTFPFEEAVLLLTDVALYAVRFDWNTEKVSSFEKVDLRNVLEIFCGVYITSTLSSVQTDEQRNVGFVVRYNPGDANIAKVNTRSLSTVVNPQAATQTLEEKAPPEGSKASLTSKSGATNPFSALASTMSTLTTSPSTSAAKAKPSSTPSSDNKILCFKALPARSSLAPTDSSTPTPSEREHIRSICDEIQKTIVGNGVENASGAPLEFGERDIISLAEARKSTGYLETWSHELKKLVWA